MSWSDDETVNPNQVNTEELVQMILLNKKRKVRIKVELRDEANEVVPLKKICTELLGYVNEKFEDEDMNNNFVTQVYPLLANMLSTSLAGSLDANLAAAVLTNNLIKDSFMMTMSLSFLLLQYIKQNNLSINTIEEPLSDEQIEQWDTRALISAIAGKATMLGIPFKTAIATVWKQGLLTLDQASQAFGYPTNDEELNELAGTTTDEADNDDSDTETN